MRFRIVYRARMDWDEQYATAYAPACSGDRGIYATGDDGRCRYFAFATYGQWWAFVTA